MSDLKRDEEAEQAYRKAIELNPSEYKAHYNLGGLLRQLKRDEEAEQAYRKAIELNPSEDKVYSNLINLLRLINRSEDAVPLLKQWIGISTNDFNPLLALEAIKKQFGKENAKENIEKARQLISKDDWYNLACLESVCDNFDLAFEYLEKASKQEKFDSAWAWKDPDLQWIRDDPRFIKIVGTKPE